MVCPPSASAVPWATVSMPRASPETTVRPSATHSRARRAARRRPCAEGARVPTMATDGVSASAQRPRKYSSATGWAASCSRGGYSPVPCTRTPKCRMPATRMAASASCAQRRPSAGGTKSEGRDPGWSRNSAAMARKPLPGLHHSASYAPSSRIGERVRAGRTGAAVPDGARRAGNSASGPSANRSAVMAAIVTPILYACTVWAHASGPGPIPAGRPCPDGHAGRPQLHPRVPGVSS